MEFTAKAISCQVDEKIVQVGFADDRQDPTRYVLLTRDLDPDEQDQELGMNLAHIEINSQRYSGYVERIVATLSEGGIHLSVDPSARKELGGMLEIDIRFDPESPALPNLVDHLRKIVGSENVRVGN